MEKHKIFPENNSRKDYSTVAEPFPFHIRNERFSCHEQNCLPCHWHPEIEFTCVTDGSMEYQVNGRLYEITAGNGVFINSNVLHTAKALHEETDCCYTIFRLNPILISGYENSLIYNEYIFPICAEPELFSEYIDGESEFGQSVLPLLMEAAEIENNGQCGYELLITEKLCYLWFLLFHQLKPRLNQKETGAATDADRLKTALAFIQSHYTENIVLQDIASSCRISKSECCHLFKRTLRQTPFAYLLNYRIRQSLPLLRKTDESIAAIAAQLGFRGSSYFAETFKKVMSCSPRDYRKKHAFI